jgi:small subunit ribosomal protein S9
VTEADHPEDEQRNEEAQPPEPQPASPEAEESAAPAAEAAEESAGEAAEAEESAGEAAEAEEPVSAQAEEAAPPAPEAAGEPEAAVEEPESAPAAPEEPESVPATPEAAAPEQPPVPAAEAPEQPAAPAAGAPEQPAVPAEEEAEEIEVAPRQRPEIPGADLIPDIVSESEEFLDAEARAAAEAEAEEAARTQDDQSEVEEARPIADAAIDLAAGARYTATGKRKTAVARVILKPGTGTYSINGKDLDSSFPRDTLRRVIRQPLETVGYEARMDVVARMHGGGIAAQAGALRHGISRALIVADPNLRGELKRRGFLTRDPRVKERKKAGLKKARKRPQFSKR